MCKKQTNKRIDLHGFSLKEAISKFIQFYNQCVIDGYKNLIEIIHGYGSNGQGYGDIRRELRAYLKQNTSKLGSFLEGDMLGNPGITIICARHLLPPYETQSPNSAKVVTKIKW